MAAQIEALALTIGDPAGIGPDITLQSWQKRHDVGLPPFFVVGSPDILKARARLLGLDVPISEIANSGETPQIFKQALPVLPIPINATEAAAGRPDPAHSKLMLASIEKAVELALAGKAGAVVTNPVSKHGLKLTGFAFPGHTEFLADLANRAGRLVIRPVMLLAAPELRVVPATIHIPLKAVPEAISQPLIVETATILRDGLRRHFGFPDPRIAICGLNPHAGEEGDIGREEIEIIAPAIEELRAMGYRISGPHPADTLFHEEARAGYDAVIAMYHDQALIPLKTLAFHEGVNVTLGLPFIRTSPDHGTAYNLAGTGRASPSSLIAALKLATEMAERAAQSAP